MRLLLAVDTWALIGGSERYAGAVGAELAARGHQVHVLAARRGPGEPPAELEVSVLPAWGDPRASGPDCASLAAHVAALAPDACLVLSCASEPAFAALLDVAPVVRFVQDHTPFCPGLNKLKADGSPCREPMGSPCLSSFVLGQGCHGFRRGPGRSGPLDALGALRKHLLGFERLNECAVVLVASEYMRRELQAAGLRPGQLYRVPYFTGSNDALTPRAEPDAATRAFLDEGDAPLILAPARLALPDKGIDYLLSALASCEEPWRAVIAGSGPAEAWLRQKARDEGLAERVHFSGWQPAAALESLYAASHVVAFPSVWDEPFGLVGLEAMAHARPVVAFDVGGVAEWLVDGFNGRLVARADTQAFARALDGILADPALAREMGRAGSQLAARGYSREKGVSVLEVQLERAVRRTSRRRAG